MMDADSLSLTLGAYFNDEYEAFDVTVLHIMVLYFKKRLCEDVIFNMLQVSLYLQATLGY